MSRNKVFSIVAIVICTIAMATVSFADVNVSKAQAVPKVLAEVCDLNQPTAFVDIYGKFSFDYKMTDSTSTTDSTVAPHVTTYTYTDSIQVKVDSSVVAIDTTFQCEEMLVSPETLYRLALDTTGIWVPSEEYLKLFSENFKDFDLTKLDEKAVTWQKQQEELAKAVEERKQFVADSLAIELQKAFFAGMDTIIQYVPNEIEALNKWMDMYDDDMKFAAVLMKVGFDKRSAYVYANQVDQKERQEVLFVAFTNAIQLKNFARHVKRHYVEVSGPAHKKLMAIDSVIIAQVGENLNSIDNLDTTVACLQEDIGSLHNDLGVYKEQTDTEVGKLKGDVAAIKESMTSREAWQKKMEMLAARAKYDKKTKNGKIVNETLGSSSVR